MDSKIKFILNDKEVTASCKYQSSLLDFIRNEQNLKGTKEVCREGDCGACTVLIGEIAEGRLKYESINSCIYPIGNVAGKHVVTVEGLSKDGLSFVQNTFVDHNASQCGFCTPGFINSFTGYLINSVSPNVAEAKNAIAGNICRCTGYNSILRAVQESISYFQKNNLSNNLSDLAVNNIIPDYFLDIQNRLESLASVELDNNNRNGDIIIGGGTDLLVQKEDYLQEQKVALSLFNKHENKIYESDGYIHIKGNTTFEYFKNSNVIHKYFPRLKTQIDLIASLPIRNSATIAGNIVNASPIADITIILLALDTKLSYIHAGKTNSIDLRKLYSGYKKLNIPGNSYISEVVFKIPSADHHFNFEKVSKRTYLDIASVNSAVSLSLSKNGIIESISISAGGVAPIPKYLENASNFLLNKNLSINNVVDALEEAEKDISPISDIRGSKEYKALLLKQLIKAHFLELFPDNISTGELL